MEGIEFYCVVYYYCLSFGRELWPWFTTLVLTRLSILCCENSTDSYLDDCFSKPSPRETKLWLDLCGGQGQGCPASAVLMKLIISTQRWARTSPKLSIHVETLKCKQLGKAVFSSCGTISFFFFSSSLSFSSTSDGVPDTSKQAGITSSSSCFQYPAAPRNTLLLGNNDCVDNIYSDAEQCVCPRGTFHSGSPMTLLLQHTH